MARLLKPKSHCGVHITFFFLLFIFCSNAIAARYAYIPILRSNGLVYIVNTSIPEIVTSIPAHNPTGVAIKDDGSKVYVTQRYVDEEGNILIIDAYTNEILSEKIENIGLVQPASIVYHKESLSLYVTHNNGVTRIQLDNEGLPTGETTLIPAEYNSGEIDYMGNWVFTTGVVYDQLGPIDSGISMIDTSTDEVIANQSLANGGSIGLAFDEDNAQVFVTNRTDDTVTILKATSTGLSTTSTIDLEAGSGPYGVSFDSDYNRLYIANSATVGGFSDTGTGNNGSLARVDLATSVGEPQYFGLSVGDSQYSFGTSLHPLALNYIDRELYVLKNLWLNLNGGVYLSIVRNAITGLDLESEIHIQIDSRNIPQFTGRFVGPECELCSGGSKTTTVKPIRRNGLNAIFGISMIIFLLIFRHREKKSKICNS
jgi:hypothetical protein